VRTIALAQQPRPRPFEMVPSNEALQQTGGEGGSRRCGSPFGEPVERSRRVVRRPQLNAGVRRALEAA